MFTIGKLGGTHMENLCTICTNFLNLKLFQNFYFIRTITELFSVFVIYPKFTAGPAYEHYVCGEWGKGLSMPQ